MRKFLILLSPLIFFSPCLRSQNPLVTFQKEFHNYKLDGEIRVSVLFKGDFYCLKTDNQIFIVNAKSNLIDNSYQDNSKAIGLQNLYLRNDTLIGEGKTETYFLKNDNSWVLLRKGIFRETPVLSDDNYTITSTCSGEWGGSLYFRHKKTNKIYKCNCTCAVNVIKSNGAYLATASLSHMAGFANIFIVDDPSKLKPLNKDYLTKGRFIVINGKKTRIGLVGEDESSSKQGTRQLIDSIGITIASGFLYNSVRYFIVEKYKNVSIDTIRNNVLVPIDDLTKLNIWSDYPENRTSGQKQVYTFTNEQNTGFVFIDKNRLSFYIFNRQKN